jgi:hypothetical protein
MHPMRNSKNRGISEQEFQGLVKMLIDKNDKNIVVAIRAGSIIYRSHEKRRKK